jgi:hypothetical protein
MHAGKNRISKDNKTKRKDEPEMSSEIAREFQTVLEFYSKSMKQVDQSAWRIVQNIGEASTSENSEMIAKLDKDQV